MLQFLLRRLLFMVPTLLAISIVAFVIIQLPPGDFLTTMVAAMAAQDEDMDQAAMAALEEQYGLGQPVHIQYLKWMQGIVTRGDFGDSFGWNKPVSDLVWGRLALTFILSLASLLFVWVVAFPIGIYSAVKQYSFGDYFATFIGFLGLATPNFLLALILMYIAFKFFNQSVGGLFSPEYQEAPWSWGRVADLFAHLWVPVVIIGTAGTASLIRIMRANLLDELRKPYVVTARAKGLPEWRLLFKYPVRVALNPFVSTVGWVLPTLVSGAAIVSIVLSLPTTGPLLIRALLQQDMYLAASFIMLLSILTVIGTLVSDLLLAWLDPRIRME
ncbi:MAG: ABC transporter permease [Caldilineaceae bacterium]|nr:ABC transporter permease [Caldilineaceae bacterium]MDE0630081.1 ABC transporter permease [Caldilineaceae bacterium]MXZ23000.1 ABC transporter permease [Caldilineaceae bacterium SB0665_bin_25]